MVKDNVLVSRAQAGDEQAFSELVKEYHAFVYAIVSGVLDDLRDAEEVVQDTFINAYRGLAQLENPARFRGWLAEIARNCARDQLRKHNPVNVPIDEVRSPALETSDSTDARLIQDEQRELVRRAMMTLSQKDREIARAYYLDGASYDELIRTHGLSYKAISFRLSRAKRTLTKRLKHLLSGVFIPPATTLKNIGSGGLTGVKIGTVPKITVGVIAILALAFIGSRQLLSPEEDSSPSVEVTASTTDKPEQSGSEIDANRKNVVTVLSRIDEPQISVEEMEQIEDFFAQLEAIDALSETEQLAEAEFRQDADESVAGNTDALTENTEQSAEEVMNAFLEAFRTLDRNAMRSLLTSDMRKRTDFLAPVGFSVEVTEVRVEERDGTEGVEHQDGVEEEGEASRQLEQLMLEPVLKMVSQAEVVNSGYVGDEFHFRLGMPALEVPKQVPGTDTKIPLPPDMPIPDILIKMRKEDNDWRIYDGETL